MASSPPCLQLTCALLTIKGLLLLTKALMHFGATAPPHVRLDHRPGTRRRLEVRTAVMSGPGRARRVTFSYGLPVCTYEWMMRIHTR